MTYEPREGVDYIVDLYAVANVAQEAEPADIKSALNDRLKEYHPDRLQGLAPEFRAKGERMARMLNRAKLILLDPEARTEYDEILGTWEGPTSKDGTPVITVGRYGRAEAATKTPEEVEADIAAQIPQVESMSGHSTSQLGFLEKMVEQAGDDVPDDLRQAYEDALLSYDRALSIEEANRGDLLNLPNLEGTRYVATLDYAEEKALAIETARKVQKEEIITAALGGVGTRLALLAGENAPKPSAELTSLESIALPAYFEDQAQKVLELAGKRQTIVEKRLANFRPTYPEAELQAEAQPVALLGIGGDNKRWFGFMVNTETASVDFADVPEEIEGLLTAHEYAQVIQRGFNVLTFEMLDQIDANELLEAAINSYVKKYQLLPDEE